MSPDERESVAVVTRALRRARVLAIAEAIAWAAAVAAVSRVAAVLVAAAAAAWRLRGITRDTVVRRLERTHPEARNVLVTAAELNSGRLTATAAARHRVFARAAAVLRSVDLGSAFPARLAVMAIAVAAAAWLASATAGMWRPAAGRMVARIAPAGGQGQPSSARPLHVSVRVEPPAYTGRPATTAVDPPEIAAVEGSTLTLALDANAARATIEHDGVTQPARRDARGQFVQRLELKKTGYVAVVADPGGRRVIPIVVSPDALPAVRVTVPDRDLVFADANQHVSFDVHATDDFGLRALSLQYTKVSGSGEQFAFKEGEIPLSVVRASDRDWRGRAARALPTLDLKEGDMLVYRAVAADARPGGGTAMSDALFIEISKLGVAAGDAFTLPEQETRYALSQQMLIVKTERLNARRSRMSDAEVREEALNLAVEQRMIRAEFVFMLGGEVEDEEVEAEQSTELQAGRLENRGQRDLRAATVAMSEAGRLLTAADTVAAVKAERAAVGALQRAFSRDRYILRALATRTELDAKRRLTGNVSDAVSWRRQPPESPPNRRAALLQDLLAGVGALREAAGSEQAVTLAREALAIDAGSPALRSVASNLQQLADRWSSFGADERRRMIDGVGAAVAAETARALAVPPPAPATVAAPLAGAFDAALRRGGSR